MVYCRFFRVDPRAHPACNETFGFHAFQLGVDLRIRGVPDMPDRRFEDFVQVIAGHWFNCQQ